VAISVAAAWLGLAWLADQAKPKISQPSRAIFFLEKTQTTVKKVVVSSVWDLVKFCGQGSESRQTALA
jgi:CRISPR/Cas system CMR-associated protein Cmr1 (group 7 of RAMP superfamily)